MLSGQNKSKIFKVVRKQKKDSFLCHLIHVKKQNKTTYTGILNLENTRGICVSGCFNTQVDNI